MTQATPSTRFLTLSKHLLLLGAVTACALILHHKSFFFINIGIPHNHGNNDENTNAPPTSCQVSFYEDILSVDGRAWFSVGKACVRRDGKEICDGSFKRGSTKGRDNLGLYQEESVVMDKAWKFWRRSYGQDPATLMFGQEFLQDFNDTQFPTDKNIPRDSAWEGMSSWFPSFKVNGPDTVKGFLELNGLMAGSYMKPPRPISQLLSPGNAYQSGPIAFFNEKCVLIMSSASAFMSTSGYYRQDMEAYGYGVMGSVTHIPQHHTMSVILSASPRTNPDGIRQAFLQWGSKLLTLHGTKRPSDVTVSQLQYSTDNGAFYYYQTEPNKNYQETIIDVKAKADALGLPFKSWLMDSWWYYQGISKGVTKWQPRPEIFPDGIEAVTKATKWNVVAHNRYWGSDTTYAKANGGEYDFYIENKTHKALPQEQRFWNDLLSNSTKTWGLTVYEQDWLDHQTEDMEYTLLSVNTARDWLLQMGNAAKLNDVRIQYCMSFPKHILQSLEVDYVTQARASNDYWPTASGGNWNIGITSMFLNALGIAPTKDNFWSSSAKQNHTYGNKYNYEEASRIHAIVSAFSTGMVAPSDSMDHLNVTLIMKTCAQDGRLLQPDLPAVPLDTSILSAAKIVKTKMGSVWSTKTELSGQAYTYILALSSPPFTLTQDDLYVSSSATTNKGYVVWEVDSAAPLQLATLPLNVPNSYKKNVHVYAIAPILSNGYVFLGEATTKFVPISKARFSMLLVWEDGFSVKVHGAPTEVVELVIRQPNGTTTTIDCKLPTNGVAMFTTNGMACH